MNLNEDQTSNFSQQYKLNKPDPLATKTPLKGLLSKHLIIPNKVNIVYTVPSNIYFVNCSINIINDGYDDAVISIYVTDKEVASKIDLIEASGLVILSKDYYLRDNFKLSSNESIIITTVCNDLIVRVDGIENFIV